MLSMQGQSMWVECSFHLHLNKSFGPQDSHGRMCQLYMIYIQSFINTKNTINPATDSKGSATNIFSNY